MKLKGKICLLLAVLTVVMVSVLIIPAVADNTGAEIHGDKSRFSIEKNLFYVGEPIIVTAKGTNKDWVALIPENYYASANYYYCDKNAPEGVGSGVPFDIQKAPFRNDGKPLRAGTYRIALFPSDVNVYGGTPIAYADIKIIERDIVKPKTIKDATYKLENDTDGYAKGTITVKTDADQVNNTNAVMYWGDDNGKLKGYGPLSKFKITGTTTVSKISDGVIIPYGATKLLVYTTSKSEMQISEDCFVIDLPAGAASKNYKNPLFSYTVVSDIHITMFDNHLYNKHFKNMLEMVTELRPDSIGTVIVGDIADQGQEGEFENMNEIYKSVKGAVPLYMSAGDHDMRGGMTIAQKAAIMNKYITLPDGSHPEGLHYDFWKNGYHFIFLGTDHVESASTTTLSKKTLQWLDETLAEKYDPERPPFIFLHQPLPNTIVGSLKNKYGQYWGQVSRPCERPFRQVLEKYPEAILFNGHTHGLFDSEANIYMGDPKLPTIINTGAVAYEWDTYNDKKEGQSVRGSEGYIIDVYPEKVVLKGINFETGEWVPNAQYILRYAEDLPVVTPEETETETEIQTETGNLTPEETQNESTNAETDKEAPKENNSALKNALIILGSVIVAAGVIAGIVLITKKH